MFPHQTTFTSWEIASSSYHILDLLSLILLLRYPSLSNIIVCKEAAKITLSISDHSAGTEPLNFINIQSRAWPASRLPATQIPEPCFSPKFPTSSHHVTPVPTLLHLCCHANGVSTEGNWLRKGPFGTWRAGVSRRGREQPSRPANQ